MNLLRNTKQAVKQTLGVLPADPVTWPDPERPLDQAALVQLAQSYSYWYQRIANELCGDPTNWWIPDTECVRAMLCSVGFRHFSQPTYFGETRMALTASRRPESLLKLS